MRDRAQDSSQETDPVSNQATVDTTSTRGDTRPPSRRTSGAPSRATTPGLLSARPNPSADTAPAYRQQPAAAGLQRRQTRGEQDLIDLRHHEEGRATGAATAGRGRRRPLAELLQDLERRPPAPERDKMRDDIDKLERSAKRGRTPSSSPSPGSSGGDDGKAGSRRKKRAVRHRSLDARRGQHGDRRWDDGGDDGDDGQLVRRTSP